VCVGSLYEVYRKTPKALTLSMIKKLSLDIVRGLIYIHTRKPSILHRGINTFSSSLSPSLPLSLSVSLSLSLSLVAYVFLLNHGHSDLKSMNVLVTDDWIAKIADFGLSRSLQVKHMRTSYHSSSSTSSRYTGQDKGFFSF
jgi:serine/threonine protein kinase